MKRSSKFFAITSTVVVMAAATVIAVVIILGDEEAAISPLPTHYSDHGADTQVIQPDHIPLTPEMMASLGTRDYPSPETPWLALIIDDFGPPGTARLAPRFFDLPAKVTISIIPGNLKSEAIAAAAAKADNEVFIHLPMEPNRHTSMNERDMIMVDADSSYLAAVLNRTKAELPNAIGLNNHMGSRATGSVALMTMLARELRARELVFVDSRTRDDSQGYPTMIEADVPTLWRDVFLDNDRDTALIADQLDKLIELTQRRGWAIGIGHAYKETVTVLERELPVILESGIRVVSAGELVNAVWRMRQGRLAIAE